MYSQSSAVRGTHPRSPVHHSRSTRALLLERFSSLFHHSYRNTGDANELQQRQSRSIFSRGPPIVEVAAVKDREVYISSRAFPIAVLYLFLSRLYLPFRRRHKKHSSKPSRTHRGHPRYRLLQILILLHHQDIHIHYLFGCLLILCFFSVAHPLNTPMEMHNQYSSKASHKVKLMPRRHHRRPSLLPPRHPQCLLLLLLVLPHQVQQLCSHDLFHCELASCCLFVVHHPHTPMVIDTGTQLFHLRF